MTDDASLEIGARYRAGRKVAADRCPPGTARTPGDHAHDSASISDIDRRNAREATP